MDKPEVFNTLIAEQDGSRMWGYLATPEGGAKGPGLVLMHEVYGVTPGLKALADQYAQKGFVVLCPNMYWEHAEFTDLKYEPADKSTITPELQARLDRDRVLGRELMFDKLDLKKVPHYVWLAAHALRAHPACDGTVAASGFCLGGKNTYLAMVADVVDAGVAFYATPELHKVFKRQDAMSIKKPFMFVVGGEDPYITDDEKTAMRESAGTMLVYASGLKRPVREDNPDGNPNIATLYYANSTHGFNRRDSHYSDQGTSDHALRAASEFLKIALGTGKAVPTSIALEATPDSPTYHPKPKV